MKRNYYVILLGLAAALTLSACGSSDDSSDSGSDTTMTETEAAAEDAEIVEEVTEEETEEETESGLASITPSDYLIENVSDYITVGDLDGLEVTQYLYEVTDDTVQEEIEYMLEEYIEEVEVDRAIQAGDTVYVTLTSTVEDTGDSYDEETYFYIGDADYGEEFDEALIGASAGDTVTFSITYDEDAGDDSYIDEEWVGQTVDFEAAIESVCETSEVDYTDEFIAENSDYSTIEEFETAMKEYLEDQYEEQSYSDMLEDLIAAALDNCEITSVPDDLYETCYEEVVSDYSYFLDTDDVDDILEAYDMTEDELDEEVQDLAARRLLISYICEENDIEITEEEYVSYVEQYAEYYGYDAQEYEEDMTRSYLVWSLYESEAGAILYESADVTVETYDDSWLEEDEDYLEDESDTEEEIFDADAEEEEDTDEEVFDADAGEEDDTDEEVLDADVEEETDTEA